MPSTFCEKQASIVLKLKNRFHAPKHVMLHIPVQTVLPIAFYVRQVNIKMKLSARNGKLFTLAVTRISHVLAPGAPGEVCHDRAAGLQGKASVRQASRLGHMVVVLIRMQNVLVHVVQDR